MEKEINTLEESFNSTKLLDDLREKESELERQNEEDKAVINDKNASPSEKEAPESRVAEPGMAQNRDCGERKKHTPFRKSKINYQNIWVHYHCYHPCRRDCHWRCYRNDNKRPESTGQRRGERSARYWQIKPASLLPRLISSIVSFIFIAAGQAISFLAEHTWLIILAVLASFTQNFFKRF
ncbi:unnamed protein product, partial [Porites lobata]